MKYNLSSTNCGEKKAPTGLIPLPADPPMHPSGILQHPPMACGGPFDEIVDFTNFGNSDPASWTTCHNVHESHDPDGRPCRLPLRAEPDFSTPAFGAKVWSPAEGEPVHIWCQKLGDDQLSHGTLQDGRGVRSKIWDLVVDSRLPHAQGYGNDIWFGNRGWRGRACK